MNQLSLTSQTPRLKANFTIYTDGGARGNPGPAAVGFVIKDATGLIVHQSGHKIGRVTNNIAEYQAVIAALNWYKDHLTSTPPVLINFYLDSNLVVNQLKGLFKIKNHHLKKLHFQVKILEKMCHIIPNYIHIPRSRNREADLLVNQALDFRP